MRAPPLAFLCALTALAQAPATPEIRGVITETGTSNPLVGAKVELREFAPNADNFVVLQTRATAFTDARGAFLFYPDHLGTFTVAVSKEGFGASYLNGGFTGEAARQIELTAANPAQETRLALMQPATVIGRVIDTNGNPVANLRVGLDTGGSRFESGNYAVTDAEGRFSKTMMPGAYIAYIGPARARDDEELPAYTDAEFERVDEDIEPSYWPGGVPLREMALPVPAAGGGITNLGTITVRKNPSYRVRLTLDRDCAPNERWTFRVLTEDVLAPSFLRYVECKRDSILTGIAPGSYRLAVWIGRDMKQWALLPFTVSKGNIAVPLHFEESVSLSGRVVAAEGVDLEKLEPVQISIRSSLGLSPQSSPVTTKGAFEFKSIPWGSQWISVNQNANTYVKEIRSNGLPHKGPQLEIAPGASLEIVIDQGPASLTVAFKNGETPVPGQAVLVHRSVERLPVPLGNFPPYIFLRNDVPGREPAAITGIPPGEYRLLAMPLGGPSDFAEDMTDATALAELLARAGSVTLGRGEQKAVQVQLRR